MDNLNKQQDKLTGGCEVSYLNDSDQPANTKWYYRCLTWGTVIDAIIILITVIVFMVSVEHGYVPHTRQGFVCGDPSISHQYNGDTVSTSRLGLTVFIVPALIIMLVEFTRSEGRASGLKMWSWYLGQLICLPPFFMFSSSLKVVAGELRPHFLHTCAPDAARNCTEGEYITKYNCLNTFGFSEHRISDSFMSFPSGHAGIATMASIFCAVYILKRFNPNFNAGFLLKPALSSLVLVTGFLVSLSRIVDHRHHWWDVLIGILVGLPFVVCSIIYHCDSFKVAEKEECRSIGKCKVPICRHSRLLKGVSTRQLLNGNEKDTSIVNL